MERPRRKSVTEAADPVEAPAKRRPGAPSGGSVISYDDVIGTGLRLARRVPLQDISVLMVARALNVAAPTIHYYVKSRAKLTALILNHFYKLMLREWPRGSGELAADLSDVARVIFTQFSKYPGIAAYEILNNRFLVFDVLGDSEKNYGLEWVERYTGLLRRAGHSPKLTGLYAHALADFAILSAHQAAVLHYPDDHGRVLEEKIAAMDESSFPNIRFANRLHTSLTGEGAFSTIAPILISGFLAAQPED